MAFTTALPEIASNIPENLGQVLSHSTFLLPDSFRQVLRRTAHYIPAELDLLTAAQFMLYFTAASMIFGVLGRVLLGKRSSLNRSLSATIGIFFVYVLSVVIYTFHPMQLDAYLAPLPFFSFSDEYLFLFPIRDALFTPLCAEILSLVILAFLVNLTDLLLPKGDGVFFWYILRILSVMVATGLHCFLRRIFLHSLPEILLTYAPSILLLLLIFFLFSGIINLIFGLILTLNNPFLGAMYTFFFSNLIGKQISKAVFSAGILFAVFYLMEYFGYTIIAITATALLAYIPIIALLLLLWYIMAKIL